MNENINNTNEFKLNEEENIAETVFYYQLQTRYKDNYKSYFLALEQHNDPSEEFMQRFADNPKVKRLSQSTLGMPPYGGSQVVDKETGEPGLILRVMAIKWIDDKEVEVRGSFFSGDGQIYSYHLQQENGHWAVIASECIAIS
ncbi:MAG: hypothetical protein NW237_05665 [Cyanobacteriota bacterium]|nr:hypothetical protein [Cyanobacteriota bacterium]